MYYLDGLAKIPFAIGKRFFLTESNKTLVEVFIQALQNVHRPSKTYRIKDKEVPADLLFNNSPILYVFAPSSTFMDFVIKPDDIIVKVGKSSMSAKWKKLGFEEVVCGDPFPNQLGKLVDMLERFEVIPKAIPMDYSLLQFDIASLLNAQRIANYGVSDPSVSLSDVMKLNELYLDKKYALFFELFNSQVDTNYLLNSLIYNFMSLYEFRINENITKGTWLKNKLKTRLSLYNGFKIEEVVLFLTSLINESRRIRKFDPRLDLLHLSLFLQNKIGSLSYKR